MAPSRGYNIRILLLSLLLVFAAFRLDAQAGDCSAATEMQRVLDESHKRKRQDLVKRNLFNAGAGLAAEAGYNAALGADAEITLGAPWQVLGGIFGYRMMFFNYGCAKLYKRDYVSWFQPSFYAGVALKFNRYGRVRLHADGILAYNFVTSEQYFSGGGALSRDAGLGRNYLSIGARPGIRINGRWDISCYFVYDLSPALDQKYIYETPAYDYYAFGKAINERWRVGLSVKYYFVR